MSSRAWQDSLRDILDAVAEINVFTEGMDFETFREDQKTLRAVEMNFVIIGEAAASVPDEVEKLHPEIPWSLMRGMRNRLVHAYFAVDDQIMWDTLHADLPGLVGSIQALLDSLD